LVEPSGPLTDEKEPLEELPKFSKAKSVFPDAI
jgi:hypothetical protein